MTELAPEAPTVHVVDDDESMRVAMSRLLRVAGYQVCTYQSAGEFALTHQPGQRGCLLLDLRMPGPSGLDLQASLARNGKFIPIVFLTGHGDIPTSVQAMKGGAVDFLTKPVKAEVLIAAVKTALARECEFHEASGMAQAIRARFESMTMRERAVFDRVVAGQPNKLIAFDLGTSERTVKAHRARVMSKMRAGSLADLVHIEHSLRGVRLD